MQGVELSSWPGQGVYEQEDGLGLRVGTPIIDSARSTTAHDRQSDSRSSERPKASRGSGRRQITEADRLALEGKPELRSVLPERPTDSRGSERPKASRGSERRPAAASDVERVVIDDRRLSESRGGERPKASRGSDRLKSRGSDRGRGTAPSGESEQHEQYNVEGTPLTLQDWFSNPGLSSPALHSPCFCPFLPQYRLTHSFHVQPTSFQTISGLLRAVVLYSGRKMT